MKKSFLFFLFFTILFKYNFSQKEAKYFVDSVYNSLSIEERIAQLMMVTAFSKKDDLINIQEVKNLITNYNIGSLIFFQGNPVTQAEFTNYYQSIAKTPLLIFMDAEYGVGMRLDSIAPLPYQIMLGAMKNKNLVYDYGEIVAGQCKRLGVNFNLAPVVDVNSNPNNPIINYRSFGGDVNKVSDFAVQYIKGMQENGVYGSVKHFPGHGDVDVDSHEDLPVLLKTKEELSKLELIPFYKAISEADVKSVLIAHLNLPKIINSKKIPSSISEEIIKNNLQTEFNFKGLTITDALNMKGFKKFVEDDDVAIKVLKAGNDILCMPENIPYAIFSVKKEMMANDIFRAEIEEKVKKVLKIKYELNVFNQKTISTKNITNDLNAWGETDFMNKIVQEATTLVKLSNKELFKKEYEKIVYISIGENKENVLSKLLKKINKTEIVFFNMEDSKSDAKEIYNLYKEDTNTLIVIGVHNYNNSVKNNFGISKEIIFLINKFSSLPYTILSLFGNPYALQNFGDAPNVIMAYNNSDEAQTKVAEIINNSSMAKGVLPVSINKLKYNTGVSSFNLLFDSPPQKELETIFDTQGISKIDGVIQKGIDERAFPGCQIFIAKENKILLQKSYGQFTYESNEKVNDSSLYDIASLTKIFATTLAMMKLVDTKKISLKDRVSKYLPSLKKTNKEKITIKDLLSHSAGLVSWIPYYLNTIDKKSGQPLPNIYSNIKEFPYVIPIANNLYMNISYQDSLLQVIYKSGISEKNKYLYSDLGFILLAKIIEVVTNTNLEDYVNQNFYVPLGLANTFFNPLNKTNIERIVPTEKENNFRLQLIKGYVHDYAAAMLNGITGSAGLFSNTSDLSILCQLLLNKGKINNHVFFSPKTVKLFTAYANDFSRRGLGFDKPERVTNRTYPGKYISSAGYGHTGFTGTCFWVDPEKNLTYIFLSNRIHPSSDNKKIQTSRIREKILDLIYENLK